jgi:hypothetical protein
MAGNDDRKLETILGRTKAAPAVHGMAVFPNLTAEQREKGITDTTIWHSKTDGWLTTNRCGVRLAFGGILRQPTDTVPY